MDNDLKTCKMCYQQINVQAKKCPYCHHWQSKLSAMMFHPAVAVLPLAFVFIVGPLMLKKTFDPGRRFDAYKEQVHISKSELTFGQTDCGPSLVVLGNFKNDSDVTWKDVQLEVTFFDRDKKLIDTGQKNEYSFVLPAKSEAPFKVSIKREFPVDKYVSHAIRILKAKDAKAVF